MCQLICVPDHYPFSRAITAIPAESASARTASRSKISVLRAQHIVRHRRAGKHIYYSLLDEHVIEMIHNALEHASEERKGQGTE